MSGASALSKRFNSDESGSVATVFAIALVPITLAVGAAVDYSQANNMKSKLQAALDAAILATAKASSSQTDTQKIEIGKNHFQAVFNVTSPPAPSIVISNGLVTGTVTYLVPTKFMGIAGFQTVAVRADAAAHTAKSGDACIHLLEPTQIALTINSDSQLKVVNCGVQVNSSNSEAIYVNSNSKISASDICVKGNYKLNGGSTSTPTPKINCPIKADPLASLPEPSYGGCNHTDLVVQSGQTKTLNPGVYCKKLEIQNSATVNLTPGIYFFPDTELIVNAQGKLIGDGVMLFFNNDSGFLNVNSGGRVQLKALTSGTYKGIVMFQSRASSSASAPPHIVNSDSSSYFDGMIYVPNGKVMLNSDSTINLAAKRTLLIARTMEINSYGTFVANNQDSTIPLPGNMGSAGTVALIK